MTTLGWIVPEQVVIDALNAGKAAVNAAITGGTIDALVARIFRNLDAGTQARIVTWLSEHDIRVLRNYPREHVETPCWAVIIDPEEQTQQYVGDAYYIVELGTGEYVQAEAEQWRTTVGVLTYADHAELLVWLYHLAKWIVADARRSMQDAGFVYGQRLSGRDLGFVKEFQPAFIYRRGLFLTASYDQTDYTTSDVVEITDQGGADTVTVQGPADV